MVNETHLKPNQYPNIRHYIFYKNDRINGPGGGTAIYVKNTINHCALPQIETAEMENTSIQIKMKNGPIIFHSVYYPPTKEFHPNDIRNALASDYTTILAGDLNAKHTEWNSAQINHRGTQLKKLIDTLPVIIDGPAEHTHFHAPTNSADTLDIVIIKNLNLEYLLETKMELSSDRHPV